MQDKFINFIFKNGKRYIPAKLPKGLSRMQFRRCFDNCASVAISGDLDYVEGLVRDPRNPDRWVLHAWLTDGVHAYDPTWGQISPVGFLPILTDYIGIEIRIRPLATFMLKTEYASVFANAWRDPELALKCCPGLPIGKIPSSFRIIES